MDLWQFAVLCAPVSGAKWLTYKSPHTSFRHAVYDGVRYLSNRTGAWAPIEAKNIDYDGVSEVLTRSQTVELVGEDSVRWLEKGGKKT